MTQEAPLRKRLGQTYKLELLQFWKTADREGLQMQTVSVTSSTTAAYA
jgi:hypothetical protein